MGTQPNRTRWMLFLGLTFGLATLTHAAQSKNKHKDKDTLDLEAEAKQAAKEDAEQAPTDRTTDTRGKYQKTFFGKFAVLPDDASNASQKLSPDVVGTFVTNSSDKKPGRTYLVKVEPGKKGVLEALRRVDGKNAEVTGKLRQIGPDGEAKYLVVLYVIVTSSSPPPVENSNFGGL